MPSTTRTSSAAKPHTCFAASLIAILLTAPALAAESGTQPVNMPGNWYSCKQNATNDCESIASTVKELDSRDAIIFPKVMSLTFAGARGSRAQLIDTLGAAPQFDRTLETGLRQYAWQQTDAQREVEAGITILTYDDRIISINLRRFNRYNLMWSPKHPSPPLATLEETTERRGQITLKRIKPPGAAVAGAVRIGFAGSLSPPQDALLAADLARGVRLAVEEVNGRGGVQISNGRRLPLELLVADDKRDPAEALRVAGAMVAAGVIAVIGHTHSATAIPAAEVYAKNNVTVINPAISNPLLYAADAHQGFRVVANDDRVLEVLYQYVARELKARSVAIVYENGIYGERHARSFSAKTVTDLINVVSYDAIPSKPASLAAIVKTMGEKQPDAVFYAGQEFAGGKLLAELARAGLNIPVVAVEGACTAQIAALAGDGARLLTCGFPGEATSSLPLGWRYAGIFARRFDHENTAFSIYAYDAVQAVVAAIERAGSSDKAVIADALRAAEYDGYTGPIAFDAAGELVHGAVSLYTLEGGKINWLRSVR